MKKTFLKIALLIIAFAIICSTSIYATTASKGSACALLSSERGGILSEGETAMQNAKTTYDSLGYTTNVKTDPSARVVFSNALAATVQLYCCHGNVDILEFPTGGLYDGDSTFEYNGKSYYGVGLMDWSGKKLVTMAACYTGGNGADDMNMSISAKVVSLGAQMSIGWYSEVNPYSLPDWLDNFHAEMDNGYDPFTAANRACNNYWYMNDNVKNILLTSNGLVETLSVDDLIANLDNQILIENKIGQITETQAEEMIKENNPNFDVSNYEKTYSDGIYVLNIQTNEKRNVSNYIDYTLKIGDYLTNSGYTIVLDSEGYVCQIVDNSIQISSNDIASKSSNNEYKISENDYKYYLSKAIQELDENANVIEDEIQFVCDLNTNEKKAYVTLKVEDELLGSKLYSYSYEIEN